MKYLTTINDKTFEIDIQGDGTLLVNGEKRDVDFHALGPAFYSIIMNHLSYELVIEEREEHTIEVFMQGRMYDARVMDERAQLLASRSALLMSSSGDVNVKAPMPGLVVAVPVTEGQAVKSGQTIVILESMKMQNELKAPRDGTLQKVHVTPGQSVEQNKVLVTIT